MENSIEVVQQNKNFNQQLNTVEQSDTDKKLSKKQRYQNVVENLKSMYDVYDKPEMRLSEIARMASISSAIKKEFHEFTFVGFYIVVNKQDNTKVLEIGPYVSSILATPRIQYGKGVCGSTWEKKITQIVNNVKKCHNYIACSPDVLSEIVVPVFDKQNSSEVLAVLDIDSKILDWFDEEDKQQLEDIIKNFA
jgi:L-methionine (R)-S-oxide reductase